ncbi:DUF3303 domain-containing protein [Crenobacter cavernae]|uniref:DUF3303 domain-containing protein n=1 Tax=Crenobacter cavernae TaxID=2290923 RepID=UPI00196B63F2|nr:DUF3303 family protein [Crenobacter cavernae]
MAELGDITLLGRWHAVGPLVGFALAETDDPQALSTWTMEWSDLLHFEVHPALTDDQFGQSLAANQAYWTRPPGS